MKKILLSLITIIAGYQLAYSQCTPVFFAGPEVTLPAPSQGLTPAVAEDPYSITIHIRIPEDTLLPGFLFSLPIDSAGISDITGLPPGFTWVTNSASNYWQGGTFGCLVIQGNPTMADTGTYQAVVKVIINFPSIPYNSDQNFELVVLDSIFSGVEIDESSDFSVQQNSPNPVNTTTKIRYFSPNADLYQFEVFDMIGNRVLSQSIRSISGVNFISFNRNNLASGIYFYKLSNDRFSEVRRMVIK